MIVFPCSAVNCGSSTNDRNYEVTQFRVQQYRIMACMHQMHKENALLFASSISSEICTESIKKEQAIKREQARIRTVACIPYRVSAIDMDVDRQHFLTRGKMRSSFPSAFACQPATMCGAMWYTRYLCWSIMPARTSSYACKPNEFMACICQTSPADA